MHFVCTQLRQFITFCRYSLIIFKQNYIITFCDISMQYVGIWKYFISMQYFMCRCILEKVYGYILQHQRAVLTDMAISAGLFIFYLYPIWTTFSQFFKGTAYLFQSFLLSILKTIAKPITQQLCTCTCVYFPVFLYLYLISILKFCSVSL